MFACLYVSVLCVPAVCGGQKKAADPRGLGLKVVAEDQPQVFYKGNKDFWLLSHLSSPSVILLKESAVSDGGLGGL